MAGVYDSQAEIDRDYGPDAGFDLSGLRCAYCGCNDVEIVQAPRAGSWFSAMDAHAVCRFCGKRFGIRVVDA